MFARFHQTPSRLQVSLRESRRVGGKPRCEHIASLGSVPEPMTIAGRVEFYRRASERFAKLANRIGADDKKKIVAALRARIPPVTDNEIRTVQRENAEADEKFWSGLQGMNAEMAEGNKALAAEASRKAADAEAQAKAAAEKAAVAKDRIERLAKGEDVKGGLGKPMTWEDCEKILKDAGQTDDDIRFMREFRLTEVEFDAFVKQSCELHHRREKSDRWKVLRKIRRQSNA
jgi:hypothetical protein